MWISTTPSHAWGAGTSLLGSRPASSLSRVHLTFPQQAVFLILASKHHQPLYPLQRQGTGPQAPQPPPLPPQGVTDQSYLGSISQMQAWNSVPHVTALAPILTLAPHLSTALCAVSLFRPHQPLAVRLPTAAKWSFQNGHLIMLN